MTDQPNDGSSGPKIENFAEHPVSITEVKASRAHDGALWTPRDALIDMLRRIDSGQIKPRVALVAIDYEDSDGEGAIAFNVSSPDFLTTVGIAGRVFHTIAGRGLD